MSHLKSLLGIELSAVSWREKTVSMLGGLISIIVLTFITERVLSLSGATAVIASMGASAVLLFAVPHGQLSQPWPVLAGHVFSAVIGVICAHVIQGPELAAAFAVCLSIGMMHHFKCIHPPGGATALTAVLGGKAIHDMGFKFVIFPVLVNCLIMVGVAILFNVFFGWRRYPAYLSHPATPPPPDTPSHEEIISALRSIDSFVDVNEDDLVRLSRILATRTGKSDTAP